VEIGPIVIFNSITGVSVLKGFRLTFGRIVMVQNESKEIMIEQKC